MAAPRVCQDLVRSTIPWVEKEGRHILQQFMGGKNCPPTQEAGNGGKEGVWDEQAQRC